MFKSRRRYRSRNRMKNNSNIKYIIIFLAIFIIAITIFLLVYIFTKFGPDSEKNIVPIYSYSAQKSSDYEILLKPNNFYETETLPAGGFYASKSISEMKIKLNYNFKGNRKNDIEYNYNIIANLVGTVENTNNENEEVWNRNFTIKENTKNSQTAIDEFVINEQINLDYGYYNNLANLYEKEYGITIKTILKLRLNVYYNINFSNLEKNNEKVEDYIELDIPITNTVTQVKENYEKVLNKDIFPEIDNKNIIYYVLGGVLVGIIVATIFIVIKINKNNRTPEEIYNYNIKRILKYYRDLIVTVLDEPDLTNLKVMNLNILDDLIDVAEQNQKNIIHYEVNINEESNFYVIVDNYAYIYTLTANELKYIF